MKITITSGFIFLIGFSIGANMVEEKSCRKGDFSYSPADYKSEIFMKEQYQNMFDSILTEPIYNYLCEQEIKNLPTQLHRKEKNKKLYKDSIQMDISIEPIFIDLNTFDGFYGMRKWKREGLNPKFRCGFWHYLFVISNNEYIPLTNDSIKNVEIVKSKLTSSFTKNELNRIINWNLSRDVICSQNTFLWPELIKDDIESVWDLELEIKKEDK